MWGIKRFLFCCLCAIAIIAIGNFTHNAYANTETINWYVDGETYDTTTCQSGDDIELPTTPTKKGYTFLGWSPYVPIEYLQSTGTQWFDTGIYLTDKHIIETKFIPLDPSVRSNNILFGVRNPIGSNRSSYGVTNGNDINDINIDLYSSVSEISNARIIFTMTANTIYILHMENGNRSLYNNDGILIAHNTYSTTPFILNWTAPVFTVKWESETPRTECGIYKLFYFKIWDQNVLVRDFIPVLDYNGIACMYDKVTETFFYNAGTGDFIAGPVISGE